MTQRSPRFRTRDGAPGRMCKCGHREGSHNDLGRCCANECSCGNNREGSDWGGFDPVAPEPKPVTFTEVPIQWPGGVRPLGANRWLYELSAPIRYTNNDEVPYSQGELTTSHVLVSWGRLGDTCIFPATPQGGIADMVGFNGRDGYDEPVARLQAWLDGEVEGLGCGEAFAAVRCN